MSRSDTPAPERSTPARVRRARIATLVVVGAFMIAGPYYRQVLEGRNPAFKRWRMLSGWGLDVCAAEFVQQGPDGPRRIDRLQVLHGYEHWWEAPHEVRVLGDPAAVFEAGAALCERLGPADIRVEARCATLLGWRSISRGHDDLCTGALPGRSAR